MVKIGFPESQSSSFVISPFYHDISEEKLCFMAFDSWAEILKIMSTFLASKI